MRHLGCLDNRFPGRIDVHLGAKGRKNDHDRQRNRPARNAKDLLGLLLIFGQVEGQSIAEGNPDCRHEEPREHNSAKRLIETEWITFFETCRQSRQWLEAEEQHQEGEEKGEDVFAKQPEVHHQA